MPTQTCAIISDHHPNSSVSLAACVTSGQLWGPGSLETPSHLYKLELRCDSEVQILFKLSHFDPPILEELKMITRLKDVSRDPS